VGPMLPVLGTFMPKTTGPNYEELTAVVKVSFGHTNSDWEAWGTWFDSRRRESNATKTRIDTDFVSALGRLR